MYITPWLRTAAALVVATSFTSFAEAQTARSGGGGNAQLVQQLQQLASERTALQAENARMKQELAELTRERDSLRAGSRATERGRQASEAAAASTERAREAAERDAESLRARMQELITRFRGTAETLKQVETERAAFRDSLNAMDIDMKACNARNESLYALNKEVLARLESDGVWSRMARAEPFTQLKRVQLENLVDEYRYRADSERASRDAQHSASSNGAPGASGDDPAD